MDALTDDNVPQLETQATSAGRTGTGRPKVLIIGGGFGGLFCARRLGRVDVDVTLLDRAACHVFQPLLYQCATGTLSIATRCSARPSGSTPTRAASRPAVP